MHRQHLHNIYRWERGTVGLTERYRLYYCVAFGISPDDFGAEPGEQADDLSGFSAGELAVLDLAAGVVGLWREFRREMAITRDEAGGDGLAGTGAGTHDRSS